MARFSRTLFSRLIFAIVVFFLPLDAMRLRPLGEYGRAGARGRGTRCRGTDAERSLQRSRVRSRTHTGEVAGRGRSVWQAPQDEQPPMPSERAGRCRTSR